MQRPSVIVDKNADIAMYIDDKDLLELCVANKNFNLCNDENFWMNRT